MGRQEGKTGRELVPPGKDWPFQQEGGTGGGGAGVAVSGDWGLLEWDRESSLRLLLCAFMLPFRCRFYPDFFTPSQVVQTDLRGILFFPAMWERPQLLPWGEGHP